MHTATRGRPSTYAPGDGSRTQTITNDPTQEEGDEQGLDSEDGQVVGSLRLRGGQRRTQRVAWNDDVVDNEGCGKKKSKSKWKATFIGFRSLTWVSLISSMLYIPQAQTIRRVLR